MARFDVVLSPRDVLEVTCLHHLISDEHEEEDRVFGNSSGK